MSSETFHPEWLQNEQALGARPVLKGTPEEILAQFNGLMAALAPLRPPPDSSVVTKDIEIEGIKCRVYTPSQYIEPGSGSLPVGIYTHGGGFICGDLDSEDPLCREVSKGATCVLVSVDYRLGPQYKLPIMLQDTLAVYKWVWDNASQFNGDRSKFFSIGGSAGGGLALAVANHFAESPEGHTYIQGVVAIVPVTLHWNNIPTQFKAYYKSYEDNAENVPVIDKASMETFYQAVDADPTDAGIFTALSPHHENFPPTYICTCGADPLRDDGTVMAKALTEAGVRTKIETYPNLPHYFWIFPTLEVNKAFVANTIAGIKWVLSGQV